MYRKLPLLVFLDRFSGSYNNTSLLKMLLYIPDAWWLSLVFKALTRKFTEKLSTYSGLYHQTAATTFNIHEGVIALAYLIKGVQVVNSSLPVDQKGMLTCPTTDHLLFHP
uniref:Uncharacterized protein n=1 Tax=Oryza nivara TaxID=4536 RepID=A0A0E0IQD0_ORYNI